MMHVIRFSGNERLSERLSWHLFGRLRRKRIGASKMVREVCKRGFVTCKIWNKLGVKSALSTAFHPQTNGETERVNQELEQYLHVFCNFQADNWADLLPFMEFAHNAQAHSVMGKSPFEVWYKY